MARQKAARTDILSLVSLELPNYSTQVKTETGSQCQAATIWVFLGAVRCFVYHTDVVKVYTGNDDCLTLHPLYNTIHDESEHLPRF